MKLSPLPGYVYVEAVERNPSSLAGFLASIDSQHRNTGRIVAVAAYKRIPSDCCVECCPSWKPGMDVAPMDTQVGQYVLFKEHAGDILTIAGRTFYNVHENDLVAVMDEKTFHQLTPVTT